LTGLPPLVDDKLGQLADGVNVLLVWSVKMMKNMKRQRDRG
jgi:hypothetical protein